MRRHLVASLLMLLAVTLAWADPACVPTGLPAGAPVPVDAVTASGSGLDPGISVELNLTLGGQQ